MAFAFALALDDAPADKVRRRPARPPPCRSALRFRCASFQLVRVRAETLAFMVFAVCPNSRWSSLSSPSKQASVSGSRLSFLMARPSIRTAASRNAAWASGSRSAVMWLQMNSIQRAREWRPIMPSLSSSAKRCSCLSVSAFSCSWQLNVYVSSGIAAAVARMYTAVPKDPAL